jgi:hypothetical protein
MKAKERDQGLSLEGSTCVYYMVMTYYLLWLDDISI